MSEYTFGHDDDAVTYCLGLAKINIDRAARELERRGETRRVPELSEASALVGGVLMDREGEQ